MYFSLAFAAVLVAICNVEAVPQSGPNNVCKRRNEYIAVGGSCDSYIECRDYVQYDRVCPDGLNFNQKAEFPNYPCDYSVDVPCAAGAVARAGNPTKDCPHQYGIFPSLIAPQGDCGQYRMCVEGQAFEMRCPPGLAFNPAISRCDWPDQVPNCNAAEFLSFMCPEGTVDASGNPVVTNHKYNYDCYAFYTCQLGKARLLSCDPGFAFDEYSGRCVDADQVVCSSRQQ